MPARRVNAIGCLVGLGLCLTTGCTIQIGFGDKSTKPPPETHNVARPHDTSGVNGNQPSPLPPANNGTRPLNNGVIVNHGVGNGGVAHGLASNAGGPPVAGGVIGTHNGPPLAPDHGGLPHELAMRSHPPYTVAPPDILLIDTIRMIPKAPYVVSPLDVLNIRLAPVANQLPIDGQYIVGPDGAVNLGYSYGVVRVGGLTLTEAERVIRIQLKRAGLIDPQLFVGLAQFRGVQQARGEHLVSQDGTISLGTYGCVYVAGLTRPQVKVAIERHLSNYVQEPEVTVDVLAYNSKYYYVIADNAGYGQQVFKFPIVGNETVLDAINNIGGVPAVNSVRRIWVARPAPADAACLQILPVDWLAITQGGATATNYQLFPGDRVYLNSDPFIKTVNQMDKVLAPFERILSTLLLGTSVVNSFRSNGGGGNNVGFIAPLP